MKSIICLTALLLIVATASCVLQNERRNGGDTSLQGRQTSNSEPLMVDAENWKRLVRVYFVDNSALTYSNGALGEYIQTPNEITIKVAYENIGAVPIVFPDPDPKTGNNVSVVMRDGRGRRIRDGGVMIRGVRIDEPSESVIINPGETYVINYCVFGFSQQAPRLAIGDYTISLYCFSNNEEIDKKLISIVA